MHSLVRSLKNGNISPEDIRYESLNEVGLEQDINIQNLYLNSYAVKKVLVNQYEEIISGNRKNFSPGTFMGFQGKINCSIITKHVIEERLGFDFSRSVHELSYKLLYQNHLRCTKHCFDSIYDLLIFIYPERKLKPYYFKKHKNVWLNSDGSINQNLCREAIREFVGILTDRKGKYGFKLKSIPKWINYKLFQKKILPYGASLSYMLNFCFSNSPINAIIFAYPELRLKPHYFNQVPKGYWKGDKGIDRAREVMNELYKRLTDKKGLYKLSNQEFKDLMKYKTYHKPVMPYGKNLGGMLQSLFDNSPQKALNLVDVSRENFSSIVICNEVCEVCSKKGFCQQLKYCNLVEL